MLEDSKLLGLDCIEQYLPHHEAIQFGMDQDLPARVARVNESCWITWKYYSKPITNAHCIFHLVSLRLMLPPDTWSGGSNRYHVCMVQVMVLCQRKEFSSVLS